MVRIDDPEPATRAVADQLDTTPSSPSGIRDDLIKKGLIYSPGRDTSPSPSPG